MYPEREGEGGRGGGREKEEGEERRRKGGGRREEGGRGGGREEVGGRERRKKGGNQNSSKLAAMSSQLTWLQLTDINDLKTVLTSPHRQGIGGIDTEPGTQYCPLWRRGRPQHGSLLT